ncbi:ubiquitin carboxyl-terminal hydrolase CYLD isoform X2 [Venturia canescens]|uniref:ubiquitin carboxyl-terminal hydrolase CYLD isoform X2 n=1 Tax=Venturia canescens TaxID=32260 RepID=UPI001C9C5744|nr:ubiquitin carboxyl-terminal hydrolase CYLD isoform X2 [Venturia canescens]
MRLCIYHNNSVTGPRMFRFRLERQCCFFIDMIAAISLQRRSLSLLVSRSFHFHEDRESVPATTSTRQFPAGPISNLTLATLSDVYPFELGLSEEAKSSEVGKSLSMENVGNEYYFEAPSKSSSNNHITNGKRIPSDFSAAFDERLNIFDDRNNNNTNRDTSPHLSNALVPKVAHKSAKSKILVNDASSLLSRNHDCFDFPDSLPKKYGNNGIPKSEDTGDVKVDSTVEVSLGAETRYGVVRWIGTPPGVTPGKTIAAIELGDGQHTLGTDGTYNGIRYFHCRPYRAIFTEVEHCQPFDMTLADDHMYKLNGSDFGSSENPVVTGIVRPICVEADLESICGKYRGIQGHHNSCYLDATLFSMFAFTSVFDNLLFRPPNEKDCPQYEEVQRVLREEIVNPLRKNMLVKADRVMKLRMLLEKLSSVSGLTSEEKDPEEFLTSLVAQILNAEPFLKLSSGQDAYHYQLFVEKDDHLSFPTVQQLLEQSFLTSNIRLKEVPSCLIIQMPRFGKSFKMYQKIQPTLLLDVTDIIEDSPRQCTVCGKLAEFECKECYGQCGVGLESIAFCMHCLEKVHRHERRTNHEPKKLEIPTEFIILQEHCPVPRLFLELSAVVCIETSHYVSFVKCGSGSEAPWCFFDSMADREGEQNGYNIPEMVPCPDFPYWLSEEGANSLSELTDDRQLPEHAKRLLCDAYMCMYQSSDIMMYK